jgi:iron(II)-dependent oxidoreductase
MQDLASALIDARSRTLALVEDLSDDRLRGPRLGIVNPPLWELGHVGWFQEKWTLRRGGAPSVRADADRLYDSAAIPHDVRWDLPLPSRDGTRAYLREVLDRALARLSRGVAPEEEYFFRLALFHEDMHDEAGVMTRQALADPTPIWMEKAPRSDAPGPRGGDVRVPGGTFLLGAARDEPFVFDNEKWAHEVELAPFAIARDAVTQGEFAAFVEDGGYERRDLWSAAGRAWLDAEGALAPVYWRRDGGTWLRRRFDEWTPVEPELAMVHVNWFEATAYCAWAGRRLPSEAEWEAAACCGPDRLATKRRFPWGDDAPRADLAHLDARASGCVAASALPAGASAFGCRQMIGNVWEWTAEDFGSYPGFVRDPYAEYSEPWFGTHKVLRGGSIATRGRLLRGTWRNFYTPERRDAFAGLRTCAL